MATLEKIRSKGWLIGVIIAIALLAFILGDFLNTGGGGPTSQTIAEVLGEEISYNDYNTSLEKLTSNYKMNTGKAGLDDKDSEMLREQTWDKLLNDIIMGKEFEELGINVSSDELYDMVQGENLDPSMMQAEIFKNKQTGQFDRNAVIKYLKFIENEAEEKDKLMWIAFENELVNNRRVAKYHNLIKGGFYTTQNEIAMKIKEENKKVSIDYVMNPFSSISDSSITITETEYQVYYDEHKYQFEQQASRTIEYVAFDVVPSEEDIANIKADLVDMKAEFTNAEDGILYANANSDAPYQAIDYKPSELNMEIDSLMFNADSGFVYGPYVEETNIYKIARLVGIKMMPDSVKARHILLSVKTQEEYETATKFADSLKTLVENGADFAQLAQLNSTDKGSAIKGGDLGFFKEGTMVKPFEDFCFNAKAGDIEIVNSQFGIHIIEVTELGELAKRINIAFLQRELTTSDKTRNIIYKKAQKFLTENQTQEQFKNYLADHPELTKKIASNLKENDKTIAGLESPRSVIRWAYKSEKGTVGKVDLYDTYIVAVLTEVKAKGTAPIEEIKEEMERFVMNNKKAEKLTAQLNESGNDVQAIAAKLSLKVQSAGSINFNAYSIPGGGFEPDVIAIATEMKDGETSKPIQGRGGVYVINVKKVVTDEKVDNTQIKTKITAGFKNRVAYQVFDALKENADVVDNRAEFF